VACVAGGRVGDTKHQTTEVSDPVSVTRGGGRREAQWARGNAGAADTADRGATPIIERRRYGCDPDHK
jgi:hypothetical protein